MSFDFDEITGNFPGWHYISLVTGSLLVAFAVFCFVLFMKEKKKNLFSYRTVAKLGLAIFFFAIGMHRLVYFFSYGDDGTFFLMLVSMAHTGVDYMVYTIPLVAACAVVLLVSNVILVIKEGMGINNIFATGYAVISLGAALTGYWMTRFNDANVSLEFTLIFAGVFCYCESMFLAVVVCAAVAGAHRPELNKDFIMILGCAVRPDGTLYPLIQRRVDKAIKFSDRQFRATGKRPVFVPSGGKGSDEQVSESEAMARYLKEHGFSDGDIMIENRSTTTLENMRFSKALMDERSPNSKIAFATSNFHVFRSGMLAKSQGLPADIEGMGSFTVWYYWPNAVAREFMGMLAESWKLHLVMLAITAAVSIALSFLI